MEANQKSTLEIEPGADIDFRKLVIGLELLLACAVMPMALALLSVFVPESLGRHDAAYYIRQECIVRLPAVLIVAGVIVLSMVRRSRGSRWPGLACVVVACLWLALTIWGSIEMIQLFLNPPPNLSTFGMLSRYMNDARHFQWDNVLWVVKELAFLFLFGTFMVFMMRLWRELRQARLLTATVIMVGILACVQAIYVIRSALTVLADIGFPMAESLETHMYYVSRPGLVIFCVRYGLAAVYLIVAILFVFRIRRR